MIERKLGSAWDVQQRCTSFFAFLVSRPQAQTINMFVLFDSLEGMPFDFV